MTGIRSLGLKNSMHLLYLPAGWARTMRMRIKTRRFILNSCSMPARRWAISRSMLLWAVRSVIQSLIIPTVEESWER